MKDANLLTSNGVNVTKSLELFGDMATYDETLETFLAEVETKLADIAKYKEIADMANYAILVHSLKSDSKYFGFDKLAELAYLHEMESKANNMYYIYEKYDELMLEANRIVNLVKQYMGKEVAIAVAAAPPSPKDKNILVVDDSDIIRNFVSKLFNDSYGVLIAHDGQEAINIMEKRTENKIVAILLDLNMPNVNGYAVLEYMQANSLFTSLPVSIITGEGSMEAIQKAFNFPIVDVLRKPFNERDVKSIVEKTIAMRTTN